MATTNENMKIDVKIDN